MKTALLRLSLLTGLLSAGISVCSAGGTEGATPFDFLFLDSAARPAALGGAYAAVPGGPETLDYNPAGLGLAGSNAAAFNHRSHFQDASQQTAGLMLKPGFTAKAPGGFAFTLNTVSFGDIARTTLSNPSGTGLGDFSIRDWALAAGYGQKIKDDLYLGIGLKYLRETIDNVSGDAAAIDIGVMLGLEQYGLPVKAGAAIQNVGTKVKFQSDREDLPANLKAGLAYNFPGDKAVIALDMNSARRGESTLHAGFELKLLEALKFRLGYNGRNEAANGLTFGAAGACGDFTLEYAYAPYGDLGGSGILGLGFKW